ncbi:hypothetical protein [Luteimonas fraxinea]|uniref:Tip attachment protein J domain-containing protein n=1 Tax=Luteimonas fraxinea TaxID=2901869 RepID=A0ABS8UC13_9GAMM|nr:hypothetical protein [Luteimonas fraxinea]MCD9097033.1 hypothetical protein [Luteimonas fraxinea]
MGESRTTDYLAGIEIGGESAFEGQFTGSGNLYINRPNLFGGDKKEGGVVGTLRVRQGAADQMPDPYMQAAVPGPWPAARGLCTTVFDGQVGAMNPYLKLWAKRWGGFTAGWTTPVWEPGLCKIGRGKNAMHILYQAFTDLQSGLGLSTTVIDEAAWLKAAQTLRDEEFGLCLPYRRATPMGEFIQIVCDHVGGMWSPDPRTGKITFRLFRPDYVAADLPLLDESNITMMESFEQPGLDGSTNEVTVIGVDCVTGKDISATYQNLANVQAQGRVVSDKRNFAGLWNRDLVGRVAGRETAIASSLLARIKCRVSASLWGIKRGDVYALSWRRKGWQRVPVRVMEVDEGTRTDTQITITLMQDFSGMMAAAYVSPVGSVWNPPDDAPRPVPAQLVAEATWRDLAGSLRAADLSAIAPESAFVLGAAAEPTNGGYGFDLWTRPEGVGEFEEAGSAEFTPNAVLGAAIAASATAVTLVGGQRLDEVEVGCEAIVGGEHCRVVAINADAGTAVLARGCVDTVPAPHAASTRIWFVDGSTAADPTEYLVGETVEAKLLARTRRGTISIDDATTNAVELRGRQALPYPPGRVRVAGQQLPGAIAGSFDVTWTHRDRLLQADQLVDTEAGSIGPNVTTRYGLRVRTEAGALLVQRTDISGDAATVTLAHSGPVVLELWAISDTGESWQRHNFALAYTPDPGVEESTITAPGWTPVQVIIDGNDGP